MLDRLSRIEIHQGRQDGIAVQAQASDECGAIFIQTIDVGHLAQLHRNGFDAPLNRRA
jgi:hypothetical protein